MRDLSIPALTFTEYYFFIEVTTIDRSLSRVRVGVESIEPTIEYLVHLSVLLCA
jgi:hypothetical protein